MIVVVYKGKTTGGIKHLPFKHKSGAIAKANRLVEKGYTEVRVSIINETVIYAPGDKKHDFIKEIV